MNPLSANTPEVTYPCGDFVVIYRLDAKTHQIGLHLLPASKLAAVVTPRTRIDSFEVNLLPGDHHIPASHGETSLVQLKLLEDDQGVAFGGGRSLRLNPTVEGLRLRVQTAEHLPGGGWRVVTELVGARAFVCRHVLVWHVGDDGVRVHTEFTNTGDTPLTLELLSSFCLGGITPFDAGAAAEHLRLHRFRSVWAGEGRHDVALLEDLHLEPSWTHYAINVERFGQIGSMPVRGWFPFAAVEDTAAGVFWGAQLAAPGSWQIEVFRRDDRVSLSGGLADREFGHWMKTVAPGETLVTPAALLATAADSFDGLCQRLTRLHGRDALPPPASEAALPVMFNEWCSTWGKPTPEFIARTAARLVGTPVKYFVIDDGWAEKPPGSFQFNGDWNVARDRFPDGLAPVAAHLRQHGFVPGLWFEFEVSTEGTKAFALSDHQLRRDGRTLRVGTRHFWDFTDPWTFDYLTEKVIRRLHDDGFGYLKVDYNETIGLGVDHPDSLGEGLRLHLEGVQRFYRKLREEIPDLVIEICSSGGHRLEPSFLALGSMASFSDAHEGRDIPIIAASLHRLIQPRQNQIWAVLHPTDTPARLHWSLAAGFLGRLCLSGEIATLPEASWRQVVAQLEFYDRVKHLIADGQSRLHLALGKSWRHPRGWQAVVRTARPAADEALVVVHAFGSTTGTTFTVPLPEGEWRIVETSGIGLACDNADTSAPLSQLVLRATDDFSSRLIHLRRV